jgi:hypothetical protein
LLGVEAVTPRGLLVRRALDPDPRTGRRRWTDRRFLFADFKNAVLGYAVTDHTAQGRTVHTGLALITGSEDRQHAYVALTRGTDDNSAYVFTRSPKQADMIPGPRPAPEIDRYDRRAGEACTVITPADRLETALGVLADVISRDGQQLSATQTRGQALSDADHLGVLQAIWSEQTTILLHDRYRKLLTDRLPPGCPPDLSHRARWLWRTLHAAELAGADAGQLLSRAIGERDLVGVRDLAAVIDARIRRREGARVPVPQGPWSGRVPEAAYPGQRAFLRRLATLMDERKARIGAHAAAAALSWATDALGPVPDDPGARAGWEQRAAAVGAYRELSGYSDPGDPLGQEPVGSPDLRAAWHEALTAASPASGAGVQELSDGQLLQLRATYPIETAWAPAHVGDQLRQARAAARHANLSAIARMAEAAAAQLGRDHVRAVQQQTLGQSYQAMRDSYQQRVAALEIAADDRAAWEADTRHQRQAAVAADAELRRRHPDQPWEPLRSAEPEEGRAGALPLSLEELAAQHREFARKRAELGPTSVRLGSDLRRPHYPLASRRTGAILQPPPQEIPASQHILSRAAERDRDWEVGG